MIKRKIWNIKKTEEDYLKLAKELNISSIIADLLVKRGYTDYESAKYFLDASLSDLADPFEMKGVKKAVERLLESIDKNEKIMIYGDYDVDGITSTSLLYEFFESLGLDVEYYIPNRLTEGYGLNKDSLETIASKGVNLVVTVDCGITAGKEILYGQDLGLEFIITDHHQIVDDIPNCIVVNPVLEDKETPWDHLSGVGVAFKIVYGLQKVLKPDDSREELLKYLDLVALGTIADIVPLKDENRILVKNGLRQIRMSKRLGINALCEVAKIDSSKISSGQVGFGIAPRLNASGRLGDASLGVKLLLTQDKKESLVIAKDLNKINQERQDIESEILEEAIEMVESLDLEKNKVLVLYSQNWHPGVIGIVASRLVERYYRPTILLNLKDGILKGSGRSIPKFHLHEALRDASEFIEQFGGHSQAAGLTLKENNFSAFRQKINDCAAEILSSEDFTQVLKIDEEVNLSDINMEVFDQMEQLEPYGYANPKPVLAFRKISSITPFLMGSKEEHLKLKFSVCEKVWEAVGFSMSEYREMVISDTPIDLAFTLDKNTWNNRVKLQLILKDIKSVKDRDNPYAPLSVMERIFFDGEKYLKRTDSNEMLLDKEKNAINLLAATKEEEAIISDVSDLVEKNSNILLKIENSLERLNIYIDLIRKIVSNTKKPVILIYPARLILENNYYYLKNVLSGLGFNTLKATGELNIEDRIDIFNKIEDKEIDVLITTSDFINYYQDEASFIASSLGLIIIDEVTHYFNSEGKKFLNVISEFENSMILSNSLCDNKELEKDIKDTFTIDKTIITKGLDNNFNLIDSRNCNDKIKYVKNLIFAGEKVVIYVNSRLGALKLASALRENIPQYKDVIAYLHEGLESDMCTEVLELFTNDSVQVIVTTKLCEFINESCANIILYDLPFSFNQFSEIVLMATRNSKHKVHLLYGNKDKELNLSLLVGKAPDRKQMGQFYVLMKKYLNKNTPINLTNHEFAEWGKIYKIKGLAEDNVDLWLGILKDLELIETEHNGENRYIFLIDNPSKNSLENSLCFLEGQKDILTFEEFLKVAFSSLNNIKEYISFHAE